jgi:hypothetical protein
VVLKIWRSFFKILAIFFRIYTKKHLHSAKIHKN